MIVCTTCCGNGGEQLLDCCTRVVRVCQECGGRGFWKPNTIDSKAEFFRLSGLGAFGNHIRHWSWEEYLDMPNSEIPRQISVRNTRAGGDTRVQRYRLTPKEVYKHCTRLIAEHTVDASALVLDESAPDHCVKLHAEVQRGPTGIEMRYSLYAGAGMREAFNRWDTAHAFGYKARAILEMYLDAPSYDCLQYIFDTYPDSTVELSSYAVSLGVYGWNTVFWEVRNY